jgi:hypothetical protein
MNSGLLRADLLIDLFAKLLGKLYLWSSTIKAENEGAFVFAMKDCVAAGANSRDHHYEG